MTDEPKSVAEALERAEEKMVKTSQENVQLGRTENQVRQVDMQVKQIDRLDNLITSAYERLESLIHQIDVENLDLDDEKQGMIAIWIEDGIGSVEELLRNWS